MSGRPLQPLEVVEEARHGQRKHPLALQGAGRDRARRLQFVVVDLDPHRPQLFPDLSAGAGRGVRDEANPVPIRPQTAHRSGRSCDRLT